MKKGLYIALFIVLGFLVQLFLHAIAEKWYINLLVSDFSTYSFGLSWNMWFQIHTVGTVALTVLGLWFGYWQGKHWWPRLYDKNNQRRKDWPKFKS